jgi:hypothetical protein
MWTCCDEEVYDHAGIVEHLTTVHGVQSPMQASQQMVFSLDGEDFSLNSYEVTIGGLLLHKTVKTWWRKPD